MFCLDYYPFKTYPEDLQQLKISYNPSDSTLEDFIEKYQNKTILINLAATAQLQQYQLKLFVALQEKYHNLQFMINFEQKQMLKQLKQRNIPFFFNDFVTSLDQLYVLITYQPSQMYICEQLGFSLYKISELLHSKNIKVRVIPNLCQSSMAETPSILKFFVRPEDIQAFSTFVDTFEIVGNDQVQLTLYKIYKQGYWAGQIKEIIPNFKDTLDGRFLHNAFGIIRSNCGKRCICRPESCDICHRFVELSETFKQNGIFIKKQKKSDS